MYFKASTNEFQSEPTFVINMYYLDITNVETQEILEIERQASHADHRCHLCIIDKPIGSYK